VSEHEILIQRAYELAIAAVENGNHPFGALLASGPTRQDIVIESMNTVHTNNDVTRHAEMELLRKASKQLGAEKMAELTLYTSTEPCAMCTGAIYWSTVSRVVFGCSAALLGEIAGDSFTIPCREIIASGERDIEVVGPILESQGAAVHKSYW
jgi:tRNA(Arg) A34 adenosine deaminase TadA